MIEEGRGGKRMKKKKERKRRKGRERRGGEMHGREWKKGGEGRER